MQSETVMEMIIMEDGTRHRALLLEADLPATLIGAAVLCLMSDPEAEAREGVSFDAVAKIDVQYVNSSTDSCPGTAVPIIDNGHALPPRDVALI